MTNAARPADVPADWLDILAESEADLAAGRIVPGDVVMAELRDAMLLRLENGVALNLGDIAVVERRLRIEIVAGHQE
jgi:hypothetical protein